MRPLTSALVDTPVVRRVAIGLWNGYTRLCRHRYSVERRLGLLLLLDRVSSIDRSLLVRGRWENQQVATFLRLIRDRRGEGRRRVFLDIGAHGGLYALLMHRSGLFDEVVAFEPDPVNLAQLQANLFLNEAVAAVRVVQAAVTDAPDRVAFHRAEDSKRCESRLETDGDTRLVTSFTVEGVRLDDVLDFEGAFVALKIDIEGHEMKALSGMTRLLAENDCVLQIESFASRLPALRAFMEERGYRLVESIRDDHFFARA